MSGLKGGYASPRFAYFRLGQYAQRVAPLPPGHTPEASGVRSAPRHGNTQRFAPTLNFSASLPRDSALLMRSACLTRTSLSGSECAGFVGKDDYYCDATFVVSVSEML